MPLEGLQNGRYRRLSMLGSGGMGEVYLMEDTRINRQVAIKVIRSEANPYPDTDAVREAGRLFQREARAISALDHPHILPLYDFGEENLNGTTLTYMVMPFCPEGSLANWVRQRSGSRLLSPQNVAYFIGQAADALQYAHDHQTLHLDIKPANFLIRSNLKDPNRPYLLLADFGIAKLSAAISSSSLTVRGTPTSMAPEQWSSFPVPATDQYALAVMTYELLVGRQPFLGNLEQLMYQHFQAQPQPPSTLNPRLSGAVDAVLLHALAKQSQERFLSISAFADAFEQAVKTLPSGSAASSQESSTSDIRATLAISKAEALTGTSRMLTLPGGRRVTVTVPAGAYDGQVIRLQNLGEPPTSGTPAGALILTIAIQQAEAADMAANAASDEPTARVSNPDLQTPLTTPPPPSFEPLPMTVPVATLATREPTILAPPFPQKKRRWRLWVALAIVTLGLLSGAGTFVYKTLSVSTPEKTLDIYCNSLLGQDYLTAYNQLSTVLQNSQTESQFANILEAQGKVTTCRHGSANVNGSSALVNLTFGSSSGQNFNSPVTLIQDSGSTWKVSMPFPPSVTLTTYCHALKSKDYQTAYDQLAASVKSQFTETDFETGIQQSNSQNGGIVNCTVSNVTENGSSATGTITFVARNGQSGATLYSLTIENGLWKISGAQ